MLVFQFCFFRLSVSGALDGALGVLGNVNAENWEFWGTKTCWFIVTFGVASGRELFLVHTICWIGYMNP